MVLKETDCNNNIVLIEKYPETIGFDGLVVETSKRRSRTQCYRIQWVQPKITSYNTCLHLRCPISVTNGGVFNSPWAIYTDQAHVHLLSDTTHICLLTTAARCNAMVTYFNI